MMKVAIVILNYNGRELLAKFLPSVVAHSAHLATIYVADNASTDDSLEFLAENFPKVKIIRNTENGGYAKGYNDALKHITEELVVLMNSDIETTTGWLEPVIAQFEAEENLAAAQPKILDYKRPDYFEYAGAAGGFIDALAYPYCRGRIFDVLERDTGQYNDTTAIFWASGACMVLRLKNFWGAGGFDEYYFAHQEEIDLCWRLRNAGHDIKYIGGSSVFHVGGATLDAANPRKTYLNFRNSLCNLLKNVPGLRAYVFLFLRLCLDGLAAVRFLTQNKPKHFIAVLNAHLDFYRNLQLFRFTRTKAVGDSEFYQIKSIIYQHFILGKKHYDEL